VQIPYEIVAGITFDQQLIDEQPKLRLTQTLKPLEIEQ